ncbi:MAG TPA: AzlD domain-containing protein [Acidimicrobiales bacterium]|jgi:branched-subunit amino acid transport protein|nr:AzlD domain-containing protein [Acidimicrobiales bacterium]|tara:strand:+ start:698 stop:994 length:297 start_codon:yes stop_codon:yes gene_type:complete
MSWSSLIFLSGGAYFFKLIGVVAGDRLSTKFESFTSFLPPALFSSIIVLMSVTDGSTLVLDARLVGVGVGAIAVWKKAPFIFVVLVAMASTAIWRTVT